MSADTLRKAAALMRERAEDATPGPWSQVERFHLAIESGGGAWIAEALAIGHPVTGANAQHIASWHPAVALAVADWLDGTAALIEGWPAHNDSDDPALRVARAYLGGDQ